MNDPVLVRHGATVLKAAKVAIGLCENCRAVHIMMTDEDDFLLAIAMVPIDAARPLMMSIEDAVAQISNRPIAIKRHS